MSKEKKKRKERKEKKRKEKKHAVPCTSTGHAFIVSAPETRSVQLSPLVTTWVDGFKTKPK